MGGGHWQAEDQCYFWGSQWLMVAGDLDSGEDEPWM